MFRTVEYPVGLASGFQLSTQVERIGIPLFGVSANRDLENLAALPGVPMHYFQDGTVSRNFKDAYLLGRDAARKNLDFYVLDGFSIHLLDLFVDMQAYVAPASDYAGISWQDVDIIPANRCR